jgi:hypothetical protein
MRLPLAALALTLAACSPTSREDELELTYYYLQF